MLFNNSQPQLTHLNFFKTSKYRFNMLDHKNFINFILTLQSAKPGLHDGRPAFYFSCAC